MCLMHSNGEEEEEEGGEGNLLKGAKDNYLNYHTWAKNTALEG